MLHEAALGVLRVFSHDYLSYLRFRGIQARAALHLHYHYGYGVFLLLGRGRRFRLFVGTADETHAHKQGGED
jgi:hypothetical protein